MPKTIKFKANNIIYIENQKSDNYIYMIKEGEALKEIRELNSTKTKKEVIKKGEFFNIRSGFLNLIKEENVYAKSDCEVYIFTPQEFDLILKKNPFLIIKVLKFFSTDLRKIHKEIEKKIGISDNEEMEKRMLDIANYYHHNKEYQLALYVYNKYLETFPTSLERKKLKASIEKLEILNKQNNHE